MKTRWEITADEYAALGPFARTFLDLARMRLAVTGTREQIRDGDLWVVIPARAAEVGDLEIHADETEVTVYVGHHTHCHFSSYVRDGPDENRQTCEQAVTYLEAVLADRVVIWSRTVNGRQTSGGTYSLGVEPTLADPGADVFLWSGRPGEASGRGGA